MEAKYLVPAVYWGVPPKQQKLCPVFACLLVLGFSCSDQGSGTVWCHACCAASLAKETAIWFFSTAVDRSYVAWASSLECCRVLARLSCNLSLQSLWRKDWMGKPVQNGQPYNYFSCWHKVLVSVAWVMWSQRELAVQLILASNSYLGSGRVWLLAAVDLGGGAHFIVWLYS